jgi:hypothetical protein
MTIFELGIVFFADYYSFNYEFFLSKGIFYLLKY